MKSITFSTALICINPKQHKSVADAQRTVYLPIRGRVVFFTTIQTLNRMTFISTLLPDPLFIEQFVVQIISQFFPTRVRLWPPGNHLDGPHKTSHHHSPNPSRSHRIDPESSTKMDPKNAQQKPRTAAHVDILVTCKNRVLTPQDLLIGFNEPASDSHLGVRVQPQIDGPTENNAPRPRRWHLPLLPRVFPQRMET